jgi:hypothetical protein
MEVDASGWSGEGEFTQRLIDAMGTIGPVRFLKVEDAPASRADAGFSFISNELFVSALADLGSPDYSDDGMLQYLRAERIVPPYQSRGYKLIELVRIYEAGTVPRRDA